MNHNYLIFPKFNPIIFSIGPITLHWYGFMYFISFIFAIWLAKCYSNKLNNNWNKKDIENLLYFCFLGIVFGGRIGYVLFYNLSKFFNNPWYLFKIWEGGMSFHGGLIGVIFVIFLFSRYTHYTFFQISDFITPLIPFGLGAGRLGNFINSELWGRVTTNVPWAMLFPNSYIEDVMISTIDEKWLLLFNQYGALPRHPSQLYEFLLEGVILFIILNLFIIKKRPIGSVSGLFLILYGIFRIFVENFRQPDIQIGLFQNMFSMGQILSIPMIIFGIILMIYIYYYK